MHVFLCLNNSLGNKWFNFKIPLKASTPSYPFQHAFWWYIWSPLCPNSIMFWPKGKCLAYSSTNLPKLSTNFLDLFLALWIWIGLPHLSSTCILQCVCTHPINPMGIHLLCCAHGNECTWTHDVIRDTFVAIVRDVGFHVGQEQIHVFLLNMFNSSCWRLNMCSPKMTFAL
jgi:hypothetical protein